MDADVHISQQLEKNLGRDFSVTISGLDPIPWTDIRQRDFIKWNLKTVFVRIYCPNCKVEVYLEDECPCCGKELKDDKCSDPTCQMNYEPEEDVSEKDLKATGSGS